MQNPFEENQTSVRPMFLTILCVLTLVWNAYKFYGAIPNIFTPNGDNLNDTFHFDELAILEISCTIFNRWGKEVYSWNELESGWDGKSSDGTELPEGSYIYVVKATGIEGKTYDLSGFFQLVRGK